jgi:hypothetical protein
VGKSNPFIFKEYMQTLSTQLEQKSCDSIPYMVFNKQNDLTHQINETYAHRNCSYDFFDIALKNWDVNSQWVRDKQYDLIDCTRCAYFSNNPSQLIDELRIAILEKKELVTVSMSELFKRG